jgi:hypothetical protein
VRRKRFASQWRLTAGRSSLAWTIS